MDGFELDSENSLFINSFQIPYLANESVQDIFPDLKIDLSLRYRDAKSDFEEKQKQTILRNRYHIPPHIYITFTLALSHTHTPLAEHFPL